MIDPIKQIIETIESEVAQRYAETCYTDSYVAFLDILGMKNLVQRPYIDLRAIFNVAESGKELYRRIQVPPGSRFIGQDHLKMTIMSDAIVLSIDCRIDQSFSKLIGFSSHLIHNFITTLNFPVFLRGGITLGQIFHDGNTVFGPALVDAYNLENEVATSMRCVVSKSVHSTPPFCEYIATNGSSLILDPEDGLYFVDFAKPELVDLLRKSAQEVLNSDANDDVKAKYRWLCRYLAGWNHA